MLKVILLYLAIVGREAGSRFSLRALPPGAFRLDLLAVMEEIMGDIITDVPEYTPAIERYCGIPVPVDDDVYQLPKRRRENDEQRRRHDEPKLVHGEVVVDTV